MATTTKAKRTPAKRAASTDGETTLHIGDRVRYSMSYVTQGDHRFYTLTLPSDVLSSCAFATSREEDPIAGFQRVLDEKRAQEIADYMDQGLGTIPTSIVLSAQPEANLLVIGGGKTLEFTLSPHSFLILDGQHRVFGFSKARTKLRIPAVIYNGLTKQQESRLFIDINTKQRPVPNELLLDIKQLADYEDDVEALLTELFDEFNSDPGSPLIGLLSPASKKAGKVSRVTFNAAVKPILNIFSNRAVTAIYPALKSYLHSARLGLMRMNVENALVNPVIFRAILEIFPEVAQRVSDRYGKGFKQENFEAIVLPMLNKIKPTKLSRPPKSHKDLSSDFSRSLKSGFSID